MKIYASITFDDGKKSHLTDYYPILKKFGFKGSFYPIVDQIGLSGRMNWEELRYLYKEGNEIGSHTYSHQSLIGLKEKEIDFELKKSFNALKEFNPKSLSYPFGNYNSIVKKIAAKYFLAGRACGDIKGKEIDYGFNKNKPDKFSLKTICLNDHDYPKYKNNKLIWLIYVIHEPPRITFDYCLHSLKTRKIYPDDIFNLFKNILNQFSKKTEDVNSDLLKLCQILKSNSIKVIPISEGVKLF